MKTIQEKNGEVEYVLTGEEYRRLHEANQAMLEALKECTAWMESVRSSGDAGNWEWYEGSAYTNGLAAIAKGETK